MTIDAVLIPSLIGAAIGAIGFPILVYFGILTNYRKLRALYAHIPQDRTFYKAFALTGGAMGGAYGAELPLLDASGLKDPWYGLIMIATALFICWPLVRFLKRHAKRPTVGSTVEGAREPHP